MTAQQERIAATCALERYSVRMELSSTSDIFVATWTAKLMEQELHDNVGVAVHDSVV